MTWNKSEKDLIKFLDDANTWHPNIKKLSKRYINAYASHRINYLSHL